MAIDIRRGTARQQPQRVQPAGNAREPYGDGRPGGVPTRRPGTAGLSALVGLCALAVTATGSWIPSLWGDEAATVLSATRSLPSLWAQTQHLDVVHAAYYLLMHYWIAAFGASPFSVRFPSAIAVGLGAAGLVVLARMLGRGRVFAVLAATLYVTLPRIQYIGQESRSFALDAALVTWTLVVFVSLVDGRLGHGRPADPRPAHAPRANASAVTTRAAWTAYARATWPGWALYALMTTVATYLLLFSGQVILIAGVALLARHRTRRLLPAWAVSSAVAVAASAPVLLMGYAQRGQVSYLANSPPTAQQVLVATWFGNDVFAAVAWALIAIAVIGTAVTAMSGTGPMAEGGDGALPTAADGHALDRRALVLAWAFLPMLLLTTTQPLLHMFAERYVASSAPAVALLMAEGVRMLWTARGRWVRVQPGVIAMACLAAVIVPATAHQRTPYSESGSDWGAIASYVHAHATAGSDILFAETVSPSKRARNSLRLYPTDYARLDDAALQVPWFDLTRTWYDKAMTIGGAVRAGRVTTPDVWVVETRGSGDEGMPQLHADGYRLVRSRHFDLDTVDELHR